MEERPELRISGPVVAGVIILATLMLYVDGYFGLCREGLAVAIQGLHRSCGTNVRGS
jgi:hypothetical protein